MVTGPPGPRMRSALKAKLCQIKLIDKQINHPNQMILANPVLKTVRKKRHLIPINPTDLPPGNALTLM
jgi:hypothetical protein